MWHSITSSSKIETNRLHQINRHTTIVKIFRNLFSLAQLLSLQATLKTAMKQLTYASFRITLVAVVSSHLGLAVHGCIAESGVEEGAEDVQVLAMFHF